MLCTIEGCDKPLKKGVGTLCSMHMERKRRHGDPSVLLVLPRGVCSIEGCDRPHHSRGLCSMHVRRLRRRGGDPSAWHPKTPLHERLMSRITVQPDGCWLYDGSHNEKGYGIIGEGGRRGRDLRTHRVAYEFMVGPIPAGIELHHACEVKGCCNPAHLVPMTRDEHKAHHASH